MDKNVIYTKWKCSNENLKYNHPSIVYETENMRSVSLPNINIEPKIIRELKINNIWEYISDVQYEAIKYGLFSLTNNKFKGVHGFLLGDGTGVGKTRTLSGILCEMYRLNNVDFRCIWLSANMLLKKCILNELEIMNSNGNKIPIIFKDIKNLEKTPGFLYSTYTSLTRENNFKRIEEWLSCSKADNVLIILDEAHYAKNCTTQIGKCIVKLQNINSDSKVIYSTATAASEVKQLHYMTKLGLWKDSHREFVKRLESYGPLAMELVSLQLKMEGRIASRHLGFDDIKINMKICKLTNDEKNYYDIISEKWRSVNSLSGLDHLLFYRYLTTHFKIKHVISEIRHTLSKGHSVVVGIQNTGESSAKKNEISCIKFKLNQYNIDTRSIDFSLNPIDMIIDVFGQDNVAEISGRSTRPILKNGEMYFEKMPDVPKEIELFQSNKKKIAIITRAGTSGISLHSNIHDSHEGNKRHHIILETPWSAESLIQQVGRTHRTNSSVAPYYTFFVSDIPSEYRFFNGLAKKFENLGALTKGDTRASLMSKLKFNDSDTITNDNFKKFMFEFNIQIGLSWYRNNINLYESNKNLSNVYNGLKRFLSNFICKKPNNIIHALTKLLQKINLYTLQISTRHSRYDITSHYKSYGATHWKYIWLSVSNGNCYSMTDTLYHDLYTCCWKYIKTYINESEFFFFQYSEWTNNHLKYPQIDNVLNTLMLCRSKPECSSTIGLLPSHLIYEIVPWLIKRNDISNVDWKVMYDIEKINIPKQIISNNPDSFMNDLFNFPFKLQNVIYETMKSYMVCNLKNDKSNKKIKTLNEYITTKKNSEYIIDIVKIDEYKQDFVKIYLNIKPKYTYKMHMDMYKNWFDKNRIKSFIKNKKNKVKFGVLLESIDPRWKFEIWYPGQTKPSLYFTQHQWEILSDSFTLDTIHPVKWESAMLHQIEKIELKGKKMQQILTLAKENALNHWNISTGDLIKINSTIFSSSFVGLVMK